MVSAATRLIACVMLVLCASVVCVQVQAQDTGDDDDGASVPWNLSISLPLAWSRAFAGWDAFPPSTTQALRRRVTISEGAWAAMGSVQAEPELKRVGATMAPTLAALPEPLMHALRTYMADRERELPARYPFIHLDGGHLVSTDRGDPSDTLLWCDDQTGSISEISQTPCRAFVRFHGRVVAVGGWRGLTSFTGELQVLSEAAHGSAPNLETRIVLPQPGLAACLAPDGNLLVVCETLVLKVRADFSLDLVYGCSGLSSHLGCARHVATWSFWGARPSVRYVGDDIMVGTEGGFVYLKRVDCPGRPQFQESWLLPKGLMPSVPPTRLYFADP